jgi:uncharacterized DUF497 family protein
MSTSGIEVAEFEWDEENERHCARHHLTPTVADEVKDGAPLFFANRRRRSGSHQMIGPDSLGRYWTVILARTKTKARWRPITGWMSDNAEVLRYKRWMKP